MATPASFLLWADFPPEQEDEFNEWYNREHVRDRVLGIPGFIQARRFVAVEGAPKYVALYDVNGPEVFQNDAYMAMRRSPDPNSRRYIPKFHNVIRFIGPALADASAVKGIAEGTWARVTAFKSKTPSIDDGRAWTELAAAFVRRPGIMRARVFRAVPELLDSAVSNMRGSSREGMRGPDRYADLLVMIEGVTEAQVIDVEKDLADAFASRPDLTPLDSARMQLLMRIAVPS